LADDSFLACIIDTDIFCTETERKQKIRRTDTDRASNAINLVYAVEDRRPQNAEKQTRDNSTDSADGEPSISDFIAGYDLAPLQRECTDFAHMIRYLIDGSLPDDDKSARHIALEADQYTLIDGRLYHLYTPRGRNDTTALCSYAFRVRCVRRFCEPITITHKTVPDAQIEILVPRNVHAYIEVREFV